MFSDLLVDFVGLERYDPIRSDISDFVADVVSFFGTFFEIGKVSQNRVSAIGFGSY